MQHEARTVGDVHLNTVRQSVASQAVSDASVQVGASASRLLQERVRQGPRPATTPSFVKWTEWSTHHGLRAMVKLGRLLRLCQETRKRWWSPANCGIYARHHPSADDKDPSM
eukprot:1790195-Amphidinium_carterae.5